MDIDVLRERTDKLRYDIGRLLLEYEAETGAAVTYIDVERVEATHKGFQGSEYILGRINVDVDVEMVT